MRLSLMLACAIALAPRGLAAQIDSLSLHVSWTCPANTSPDAPTADAWGHCLYIHIMDKRGYLLFSWRP